jgi:lipopolysaccharide biosynthesis protein
MAKEYGIYGFCYYHYWFNGKRLLERPVDEILQLGQPDFPFMLCWANENWSRRWDGSEQHILMEQHYSESDAEAHGQSLLRYFSDNRYIKVDGKPVFIIYKPHLIPDLKMYTQTLRNEAQKAGFTLYLMAMETFDKLDEEETKACFDAAVDFQPQSPLLARFMEKKIRERIYDRIPAKVYSKVLTTLKQHSTHADFYHQARFFLDYDEYVDYFIRNNEYPKTYKRFPSVTPMWDNTARRGKKAFLFKNPTPQKYAEWLQYHLQNFKPYSKEENFVFINAWNEWAEGNHLEPCQKWGRAYLEATKEALGKSNRGHV